MRIATLPVAAAVMLLSSGAIAQSVPDGFSVTTVVSGFEDPVGMAFAADGRMFVTEQRGMVWVVVDGEVLPDPFIDLREEANGTWDRGLLGLALDPAFLDNRHVYLLYTVDPRFGEPDEPPFAATWSRLTRYTGTVASGGNEADLGLRLVLLGADASTGIPVCDRSHTIGSLRFGHDGSLFISAGDGAHFDAMDDGGLDPDCFGPGMFGADENIGAFRAQYLDSLAGKILRVDPATGLGLVTNPHYTGDPSDKRSRVWANGVRNPFRMTLKPDSPAPGTLYIGDVGWFLFEEINVAYGGENLGWPCREGDEATPLYPNGNPGHSDCDSIETPDNPGPLTEPIVHWHHNNGSQSFPPGITGNCAVGGTFYTAACYPEPFQDVLFYADYVSQWIRALEVDANDEYVAVHDFGFGMGTVVDIVAHPSTGDLYYVDINGGRVRHIAYEGVTIGDVNGDCVVNVSDLLLMLSSWGPCPDPPAECPADVDGSGAVNVGDLLLLLSNWTS